MASNGNMNNQSYNGKRNNCSSNQSSITKSEYEKTIAELRKEITDLKESSNSIKKEIGLIYELKNFKEFKQHNAPSFNCLGLDWYLKIADVDGVLEFSLNLLNSFNLGSKRVKVNCKLKALDQIEPLRYDLIEENYVFTSNIQIFKIPQYLSIDYLEENEYLLNNQLVLRFEMKADWV